MAGLPDRSSARRVRWSALAAALLLGVAAPAGAQDPGGPGAAPPSAAGAPASGSGAPPPPGLGRRWQRPPFDAVLEREAGRLGLDEAALARIRAVADAARPESEALESELRDERTALHALLQTDAPELDAVLRQVERVGAAETALEKQRITTMLEIRKLLTPEQRAELVKIFRERKRERWRRDGGDAARPAP